MALVDTRDPLKPVQVAQVDLPLNDNTDTTYVDGVFFDDNQRIALLETYANRLSYINIGENFALELVPGPEVVAEQPWPATVDLVTDVTDDSKVWVVTGPNLRNIKSELIEQYRLMRDDNHVNNKTINEQMIAYTLDNEQLSKSEVIDLPDTLLPFYATFGLDSQLYVSGVNLSFFDTTDLGSTDWYKISAKCCGTLSPLVGY